MLKDLVGLFSPKSIAVIGASNSLEKVGAIVLKNIIDSHFPGKIYPVNLKEQEILGLKCYSHVGQLPADCEMAIIAIPAKCVLDVLVALGEKKIKNVIVLTAGCKETNKEGILLEEKLVEIAKKYQLNLLGPNCLGCVNNTCPVNVTFSKSVTIPGDFCFISQSGAIASSLFDYCESTGIGLSEVFSIGNKAVLGENDILEYLLAKKTKTIRPIGLYLESISDGKAFVEIATKVSLHHPLFLLKPGRTTAAKQAMQSHTGSIAGEDAVLSIALQQSGITRCDTLEDFFDYLQAFTWGKIPQGKRIAVVTNAGGPGVITSDAIIENGLTLATFDTDTLLKMKAFLPPCASVKNPIDVLGDAQPERFEQIIEIVLQSLEVDVVLILLTPQMMTRVDETAEIIGRLTASYDKPVFCSFIGGAKIDEGEKILHKEHVVNFRYPERAVKVIADMWNWKVWQQKNAITTAKQKVVVESDSQRISEIMNSALKKKLPSLDNADANELLSCVGIPIPGSATISSLARAQSFAVKYGWPVVLKLSAPGLLHKADLGGVVVGIDTEEKLEKAWNTMQAKVKNLPEEEKVGMSFQLQQQVIGGIEVIVGVKKDITFGSVLLFGLGGNLAEFVVDRNLQLLPIDETLAKKIVVESKAYTLLKGYRGQPSLAVEKLCALIVRLSHLVSLVPEAKEIEINPVIVTETAVWAVDGKVVLSSE
jgi:acetate---CoA ligase (ADP-forming)